MKNEACGARAWERGEVAHMCSIGMSHTILMRLEATISVCGV